MSSLCFAKSSSPSSSVVFIVNPWGVRKQYLCHYSLCSGCSALMAVFIISHFQFRVTWLQSEAQKHPNKTIWTVVSERFTSGELYLHNHKAKQHFLGAEEVWKTYSDFKIFNSPSKWSSVFHWQHVKSCDWGRVYRYFAAEQISTLTTDQSWISALLIVMRNNT